MRSPSAEHDDRLYCVAPTCEARHTPSAPPGGVVGAPREAAKRTARVRFGRRARERTVSHPRRRAERPSATRRETIAASPGDDGERHTMALRGGWVPRKERGATTTTKPPKPSVRNATTSDASERAQHDGSPKNMTIAGDNERAQHDGTPTGTRALSRHGARHAACAHNSTRPRVVGGALVERRHDETPPHTRARATRVGGAPCRGRSRPTRSR